MKFNRLPVRWGFHPEVPVPRARLLRILESWEGTPYAPDQQMAGVAVDCVRFVCAVLDELAGIKTDPTTMPQDAALHDRRGAFRSLRKIMFNYTPHVTVLSPSVAPGDVLVVGKRTGGPGHAMIVGPEENTIWHATSPKVQRTGFMLPADEKLFKVFRLDYGKHNGK